jgi:molybdate transport system substrate-binding protein
MRAGVGIGRRGPLMFATAAIAVFSNGPTQAEAVRVFAAGAAQGSVRQLEGAFTTATGHKLDAVFDTVGALRQRLLGGESAGIVILSRQGIDELRKAGKIDATTLIDLGSVNVALAVRKGAATADITTPEALKKVLRAAPSIAHADPARGATAGTHFARVLERLGIADEIKQRVTVLGFGGDVIEGVAQGRFEIGISQSSEIAAHPGVTLLGALPKPLDHRTAYLAASTQSAGAAAKALLRFLQEPQSRAAFKAGGFDAP